MPQYKNRTVFKVARNVKAFLNLEVGLTRGEVPEDPGQELERARKQLAAKNRQLKQMRERLSRENKPAPRPRGRPEQPRTAPEDGLYPEVQAVLDRIPVDFGGGCSVDKAYMMARLIQEHGLGTTVDIGVYRGRSLFPQALAHRKFTGGVAYGVDPWSALEARENDNEDLKETLDRFVETTDFQAIFKQVEELKEKLQYGDHCVLLRQTSAEASVFFERKSIFFGLIHIDGNHDTARVTEDVELYLPRLEENGYLVLDDISWKSVKPAYDMLGQKLSLVFERVDGPNDYAVFWNNGNLPGAEQQRAFLNRVAGDRSQRRVKRSSC